MNRGFFVMFFMYFFVVQSTIFGFVRGEPKFYIIGGINLVFILLMALFYKNFDASAPVHKKEHVEESKAEHIIHKYHATLHASKKHSPSVISYLFVISIILLFLIVLDKAFLNILPLSVWRFAGFYFVMLFLSVKKLLDKKIILGDTVFLPKDFLFRTSLIVVIGVYGTLSLQLLAFKLFLAVCIGFIFFFVGATIVKELGSSNIFKLFFVRFYLILLAVLGLILGVQGFSSRYQSQLASDRNMITHGLGFTRMQNLGDTFTGADLLANGTGQVLSSSLSGAIIVESGAVDMIYPDTLTGDISSDVIYATGSVDDVSLSENVPSGIESQEDDRLNIPLYPTLMDTLIYLMNHYSIQLSSQKNMTFTYVSPKNPYYAQFKTAYDMKLIGYSANPSKRVLCQTYMVMKGLLEERDVTSASDIKSAYRTEATERGVLNGCKRNFYVRNINL